MADDKSMPPTLVPIQMGPTKVKLLSPLRGKQPKQKKSSGIGSTTRTRPKVSNSAPFPPHTGTSNPGEPPYSAKTGPPALGGGDGKHQRHPAYGRGLPPPPKLTDPSQLPGSQIRGTSWVVIVAVDDPDHPKFASVAVNNKYPFEGNYAIPAGAGPFLQGPPGVNTTSNTAVTGAPTSFTVTPNNMAGIKVGKQLIIDSTAFGGTVETVTVTGILDATFTATFQFNHAVNFPIKQKGPTQKGQVGFYYYDDPVKLIGGSICEADLDRKAILHFTGNESDTAPTPYYKAIADHRHDGNLNPDGFDNSDPVNLGGGEVVGNLPYSNNSIILYGVVDSDGNVIATDFPDGGLTKITNPNDPHKGMYRQDANYIFDDDGFDLSLKQWLWVDWKFSQTAAATLGPIFSDGNLAPRNTTLTSGVASGTHAVTPADMTGLYTGLQVTINGPGSELVTITSTTGTTFTATFINSHLAGVHVTTAGPPSNYYLLNFDSGGTTTLKFYDINNNVLQTWSAKSNAVQSNPTKRHLLKCGIRYLGSNTYRVACYSDGKLLIDITDDGTGHTGSGFTLGDPVFPGFYSGTTGNTYFRAFDFHTSNPGIEHLDNPNGLTAPALSGSVSSLSPTVATNKTTFDQYLSFSLDANGLGTELNAWGGTIACVAKEHASSHAGWGIYGTLAPNTTGVYDGSSSSNPYGLWSGLGMGVSWDLGIAYIDQVGNVTNVLTLFTTSATLAIDSGVLSIGHSAVAPVVSGSPTLTVGVSPINLGCDIDAAAAITNPTPLDGSVSHLGFFFRTHSSTNGTYSLAGHLPITGAAGSTNTYNWSYTQLHNGVQYDFAVGWFSIAGGWSTLTSIGSKTASNISIVVSYLNTGTGGGQINVDSFPDNTYAKIKAAESTSGIVTRIGDGGGTNFRTYTHISGAIDTSSRIIGSIYDGTTTRTPANITTALDGSGRIIGSVYDGAIALTPANFTNAITNTGLVKVANATGLLAYGNLTATVTGTIDSSGNLDFTKAQSGKLLPYGNLSGTITGTIDSSGNLDFTKAQTGKLLPYGNAPSVITGVIDPSGNLLNNPFGASSGVVETSNGELTGFSATGTPTHATHPTNVTGTCINISARLRLNTSGSDCGIILGTQSAGWALKWNGSTNSLDLGYYITGSFTVIANLGTPTQDTSWHAFQISMTNVGGTTAKLEASFDGGLAAGPSNDLHVTMAGAKAGSVFMPSTGFVTDFDVEGAPPLFSEMHSSVHTALNPVGQVIGSLFDGTTALTPANVTNVITTGGLVKVANSTGLLPYANLTATVTGTIDSSGNLDFTKAQSGKLIPYANLNTTITGTIDSSGNLDFTKAQSGKLLPYSNVPTALSGAINSSGQFVNTNFSGVVTTQAGEMSGFSPTGSTSVDNVVFAVSGAIELSLDIKMPSSPSTDCEVILGTTTDGYGLRWQSGGAVKVMRYVSGTATAFATLITETMDTAWHNLRLAVDNQQFSGSTYTVEAAWETQNFMAPTPDSAGSVGSGLIPNFPLPGGAVPITVKMPTGGLVRNLVACTRHLFLSSSVPYQGAISSVLVDGESWLKTNSVFAENINGVTGTGNVTLAKIGLGSWTLDSEPDGSTYGKVLLTALTTNQVDLSKAGVINKTLANIVDGGSRGAVATSDLSSSHVVRAYTTPFGSAAYFDVNGNINGLTSAAQNPTINAYPVIAAKKISVSLDMQQGNTSNNVFVTVGDQTNGYGIRWNTAGAVSVNKWKAGTLTLLTSGSLGTVTLDSTKLHYFFVAVTFGATPGSSDTVEAWFDGFHFAAAIQAATAVTWGSTHFINIQPTGAAIISNFLIRGGAG